MERALVIIFFHSRQHLKLRIQCLQLLDFSLIMSKSVSSYYDTYIYMFQIDDTFSDIVLLEIA